jgi:hypothetical protein
MSETGECAHKQCSICLRRACQKGVGHVKQFGTVEACERCIHTAVLWAYTCACKWGGDYPKEKCGYEREVA